MEGDGGAEVALQAREEGEVVVDGEIFEAGLGWWGAGGGGLGTGLLGLGLLHVFCCAYGGLGTAAQSHGLRTAWSCKDATSKNLPLVQ